MDIYTSVANGTFIVHENAVNYSRPVTMYLTGL